ncbi:MAG: TerC/Alx family metal homeostasis membrane protein [Alphaproteobacteria bacterium]|nr:TerC/Alx family metal homeostasis membrane protein [Alphaproteobacteria bacterium]
MGNTSLFWIIFNVLVLAMLWIDLKVFHKDAHVVAPREALKWSFIWIALSLAFGIGLSFVMGHDKGLEFFSGYLVEKSLSIDNIFIFSVVFRTLSIPLKYQHRVLFWGIFGALILRGLMIYFGITLISYFHQILYPLGAFLLYSGLKIFWLTEKRFEVETHPIIIFLQRYISLTPKIEGQQLWVRSKDHPKRWQATPLFVALALIEGSDLLFAIDSVPAIFAITLDPFIVYTSNVFAILGLRSLYFLLADAVERFYYLKSGVALILCFVGIKMLMMDIYKIPTEASLLIILLILGGSIALSGYRSRNCHK